MSYACSMPFEREGASTECHHRPLELNSPGDDRVVHDLRPSVRASPNRAGWHLAGIVWRPPKIIRIGVSMAPTAQNLIILMMIVAMVLALFGLGFWLSRRITLL